MSSTLGTASSTELFHTLDHNSAGHNFHSVNDGVVTTSTNSTAEMKMVPMSPDAVSSFSEAGRTLSTESFHTSHQNSVGHGLHFVNDGIIAGETGATKSSSTNSTTEMKMVPMSPNAVSSFSEARRTSPTQSFHTLGQNSAGHNFHSVDGVIVGETGATKSASVNSTTEMKTAPTSPGAMSSCSEVGRTSSSESLHPSVASGNSHAVDSSRFVIVGKTDTFGTSRIESSTHARVLLESFTSRTLDQSPVRCKRRGLKEASRRKDTCNVVIFGQTGAGKSSLVNLITKTQEVPTSSDAKGCTRQTTVYEHDVVTQNKTLKVQLFDTAGLDEDSEGTVPDKKAQKDLKKLLRTLKAKGGIHLLMYCAQGIKNVSALQHNYRLIDSEVKRGVPVVLVVTGLEYREAEEWWRNNETSISDLGMNFSGHACITALIINEDDPAEVRQRHEQSYRAVCNLIEQCCLQNGTEVHSVPTIPARKTKNIVLFGEAGAGKSSVVNLMAGKEVAKTSLSIQRCTLHWQDYVIDFEGESYKVFDTIGIEESGLERKEYLATVANAYRFIKTLDAEGGVDLLLFCVRAGRITAALQSNYRFFHEFLCDKKVPIVLAITNLEREQKMEDWWEREHSIFARYQIHVTGHACITAANGLEGIHQQLYEQSRVTIRNLVKENIAVKHNHEWRGGNRVFVSLLHALNILVKNPHALKKILEQNRHIRKRILAGQLKRCGISRETAGQLADMIGQGEVST